MTDGGGSAHGDGTDRFANGHSDDTSTTRGDPSTDTEAHSGRQAVANGDLSTGRDEPSSQVAPTLAEPTRSGLAKQHSQTTGPGQEPLTEYTTDRRSLNSGVQIQWAIRVGILAVVVGSILAAILGAVQVPTQIGLLSIGLLLAVGLVWVVLSYRAWVYQVRDDSLYLERGVVTHVRTIVPYVRVQHVDTSRSALERVLGLSTLVVYTAGSRGADVSVPGLKPSEARDLQRRLKQLAIEADGDDAL